MQAKHTSNRELGTARDKLKEVSSLRWSKFAHYLQKVSYAFAVHVETVISFDGVTEGYES